MPEPPAYLLALGEGRHCVQVADLADDPLPEPEAVHRLQVRVLAASSSADLPRFRGDQGDWGRRSGVGAAAQTPLAGRRSASCVSGGTRNPGLTRVARV